MRKGRFIGGIALAFLCTVAASPLIAQACSVSTFFKVSPAAGAAGSQVSLFGGAFAPAPVDVFWSTASGQLGGAPLITIAGPDFSNVPLSIPATATPGFYWLVATDNAGPIQSVSQPFHVTAAAVTPPPVTQPPPPVTQPPATQPPPVTQPPATQMQPPTPIQTTAAPPTSTSVSAPASAADVTPAQPEAASSDGATGVVLSDTTSSADVSAEVAQTQQPAAAPLQPSVSNPPAPRRMGSAAALPSLSQHPGDTTTSVGGLPTPIVVGLAFAGAAAVVAAVGALIVLPRRRRSLVEHDRDAGGERSGR